MLQRAIESQVVDCIWSSKHIIIYGPRQVGKTTLAKKILREYGNSDDYYTADDSDIVRLLSDANSITLSKFVGDKKLIVIDEAQRIPNIGTVLKLIHDFYPNTQIIATGSSSFELANTIREPLTGRKYTFYLYPFALGEILPTARMYDHERLLDQYVQYGMYPDVFLGTGLQRKRLLSEIKEDYLFKDILNFRGIRKPDIVVKLLQALALQIWSEVSYTELASLLAVDKKTIEDYIMILEQAFIIYRLPSLSRNMRNEIKKSRKIYFRDTGIRNAVINNLNDMSLRADVGWLRENFCISERMKYIYNSGKSANYYFWRTYEQQEIDLIEEHSGKLHCFEYKWWKKTTTIPQAFAQSYTDYEFSVISKETIWQHTS